jgi:hypothetical protein
VGRSCLPASRGWIRAPALPTAAGAWRRPAAAARAKWCPISFRSRAPEWRLRLVSGPSGFSLTGVTRICDPFIEMKLSICAAWLEAKKSQNFAHGQNMLPYLFPRILSVLG